MFLVLVQSSADAKGTLATDNLQKIYLAMQDIMANDFGGNLPRNTNVRHLEAVRRLKLCRVTRDTTIFICRRSRPRRSPPGEHWPGHKISMPTTWAGGLRPHRWRRRSFFVPTGRSNTDRNAPVNLLSFEKRKTACGNNHHKVWREFFLIGHGSVQSSRPH